ncbi:acyltransferase family protein [Janibacter alkaliphilus]
MVRIMSTALSPIGRRPPGLTYRPAIDGVRAVAVIAVVVYHLLPQAAPGGWFGVDVFFVVSGFLITSLLLAQHRRGHGRVSLPAFWAARARRLIPALLPVLAAVLLAATVLTPAGRRDAVAGDVLATLGYVANWRFILGDEAYFGQISAPSPLRHAWSLAVEEQFYIVYPLLLLALLALARRRSTVIAVLTGLAAVSALLMVSLHQPGVDPSRVYYGTDTRAHQLLVGAVLAAVLSPGPGEVSRDLARSVDRWCRRLALPAGLVVLSAMWWAGRAQEVLLEGALVPLSVLVAVVVVAASSPRASLVQRVLSVEPLRRVGLISYGLYLWHWPLVVYLNSDVLPLPELARAGVQLILALVLAVLSYLLLERPVRRHGVRALVPRVPRAGLVVAWAAVPALVVGALVMPTAARAISPAPLTADGELTVPERPYTPGESITTVMLIGNSVPGSLYDTFPQSAHPDLRLVDESNPGCDSLGVPKYVDGGVAPELEGCEAWRESWPGDVEESSADVVLYFVPQSWVTDRYPDGQVAAAGTPVWSRLIEDALDEADAAAGSSRLALVNLACHDVPDIGGEESDRVNDIEHVRLVNDTVADWAERRDVPVIDQYGLLCPGDEVKDIINGTPLYEDSLHFTDTSGPIVWGWLAPQVQQVARGEELS